MSKLSRRCSLRRAILRKRVMRGQPCHTCCHCDRVFSVQQMTLEHIIPHSHGGPMSIKNVLIACKKCNGLRGNEDFNEFRARRRAELGLPEVPPIELPWDEFDAYWDPAAASGAIPWTRTKADRW